MKILHTSDWHLGRSLYGRKRYKEFSEFLDWLSVTIAKESIDALLVAGDIFDTSTPSNRSQELYYRFLCKVAGSSCRHIIIIAGNHDSPSFLNAPKELLRALNVYVVGAMTDHPEDEVIVISESINGLVDLEKTAIVCAIPYLRDKDIRTVEPGESIDDKNKKLVRGIKHHYGEVVAVAERKRAELLQRSKSEGQDPNIPILAMGHLFSAGSKTVEGDGVRELYVGSLAYVKKDVFPSAIDYLALGHLHIPQCVGGAENMRYSGSPIPMGFNEAKQEKMIVIIDFDQQSTKPSITLHPVPCFQPLERIKGSLDEILSRIGQLKRDESTAWLEIEYNGSEMIGNLREVLDEISVGSSLEILRIRNQRNIDRVLCTMQANECLDDLNENDIFERCLDSFDVCPKDRLELRGAFNEIVKSMHEADVDEL
jgi:DNA repair protein SbcD/Mre11